YSRLLSSPAVFPAPALDGRSSGSIDTRTALSGPLAQLGILCLKMTFEAFAQLLLAFTRHNVIAVEHVPGLMSADLHRLLLAEPASIMLVRAVRCRSWKSVPSRPSASHAVRHDFSQSI